MTKTVATAVAIIALTAGCGSEPTVTDDFESHWAEASAALQLEMCNDYRSEPTGMVDTIFEGMAPTGDDQITVNGVTHPATRANRSELLEAIDTTFAEECSDA